MFDQKAIEAFKQAGREHSVDWRVLASIAQVESGGRAYEVVNGRKLPLIRWEGHYFHRLTSAKKRALAVEAGLADPKAGKVANPKSQAARYEMLSHAKAIDTEAAISSCSWGIGQVMGSHWQVLGYSSAAELETEACSGADGQVRLMLRFVEHNGLFAKIQNGDMNGFFRAYNGPAYVKQGYPGMYAAAWKKWGKEPIDALEASEAPAMMPMGLADLNVDDQVIEHELRSAGSRTIAEADAIGGSTVWGRAWGFVSAGGGMSLLPFMSEIDWRVMCLIVLVVGAGAAVFYLEWRKAQRARGIVAARVADAKSGVNISRIEEVRLVLEGEK